MRTFFYLYRYYRDCGMPVIRAVKHAARIASAL
jgi:hypothetical protein